MGLGHCINVFLSFLLSSLSGLTERIRKAFALGLGLLQRESGLHSILHEISESKDSMRYTKTKEREREFTERCNLQVPSNDLIDSLCNVFDIVIVQTSHRDPPISSQINMSILYQLLTLFSYKIPQSTNQLSHSHLKKRRREGE